MAKTVVHKTQHKKQKNKQHEPHKFEGDFVMCSGSVSKYCSKCDKRRVAHVSINPVISPIL